MQSNNTQFIVIYPTHTRISPKLVEKKVKSVNNVCFLLAVPTSTSFWFINLLIISMFRKTVREHKACNIFFKNLYLYLLFPERAKLPCFILLTFWCLMNKLFIINFFVKIFFRNFLKFFSVHLYCFFVFIGQMLVFWKKLVHYLEVRFTFAFISFLK